MNRVKEAIENYGIDDVSIIIYDNPDYADAFVGITNDGRAVYVYERMIESLMVNDDISYEEAAEFIDYNCISYGTKNSPIIVYGIDF